MTRRKKMVTVTVDVAAEVTCYMIRDIRVPADLKGPDFDAHIRERVAHLLSERGASFEPDYSTMGNMRVAGVYDGDGENILPASIPIVRGRT